MKFQIVVTAAARQVLRRIDPGSQRRIERAIGTLANDPFPPASRKLAGHEALWRLRIGDYRAIYTVLHAEIRVIILKVGHRKDVYRS